jgi:26S proteasome regulatory subunit N2
MATKDTGVYEQLKNTLFNNADSAIIGESAAVGMGLVMIGSADESAIEEMMSHAADSNHEKIIRALGISLSLIMYARESQADGLIEQMCSSKDSTIRYGAMFTIGSAYAGTGSNLAMRRLLKFAVSDTSDDVKRAALMNLGFINFRNHQQLP